MNADNYLLTLESVVNLDFLDVAFLEPEPEPLAELDTAFLELEFALLDQDMDVLELDTAPQLPLTRTQLCRRWAQQCWDREDLLFPATLPTVEEPVLVWPHLHPGEEVPIEIRTFQRQRRELRVTRDFFIQPDVTVEVITKNF